MINSFPPLALAVLAIGAVTLLATLGRAGLARLGLPDAIGYLLIGLALNLADGELEILSGEAGYALEVLAAAGIVILLFRVGLESNPSKLLRQLPKASFALVGSIVPSAVLGYLAVRYWLGGDLIPALFVGTALTATSVGVSLAVWREVGAIDSDNGALLLDLAELDDIAGVILMAFLLSIVPLLRGGPELNIETSILGEAGWLILKLAGLSALCLLFAQFLEQKVTRWLGRIEANPAPVIPVAGLGLVVAALAGLMGFPLAIGALFAGLAFSRDPRHVKLDKAFETLSRFFVPFFFVGIGLKVDMSLLTTALGAGSILFVIAVVAKFAGTAFPVLVTSGGASALLIGASMVPRAEIAMIIMERGHSLGDWAVPPELYGSMVFVVLGTCLLTPPIARCILRQNPQGSRQ